MKHTSGPWEVIATPLVTTVRTKEENYKVICTIDYRADEVANAKLIAKAPEMYQFLKEVVETISRNDGDNGWARLKAERILEELE